MNCKHCGTYCDERRRIGWSAGYCSPWCERKAAEKRAEEFAKWWRRNERPAAV